MHVLSDQKWVLRRFYNFYSERRASSKFGALFFFAHEHILTRRNVLLRVFNARGQPEYRDYIPGEKLPKGWSIMPFFPGYIFERGVSTYRGEEVGEGGYVYAEPPK